jgi:uncharacterized protein YciI
MPYFLMICRHHPDAAERRAGARDAHRAHVTSGGGGIARVLTGGPLTEDDGETATGNFGVLDAPTREAAEAFAASDPYAQAGIVQSVEIIPIANRFQANRIDPLTHLHTADNDHSR